MMVTEARSNLSLAIRRRNSLISSMYSSMPTVYSGVAATNKGLLADQRVRGDHRRDQDGDDIDHLDHGVDRGSGGVLIGVPHRISGHGRCVGLRALAAIMAVLDVLLGGVPCAAAGRHLKCQEDAGHDAADEQAAPRLRAP